MSSSSSSKPFHVRILYVYFVSLASLIMIVMGCIFFVNYTVRSSFGQYRLDTWEETQCDSIVTPIASQGYTPSETEMKQAQQNKVQCTKNLAVSRSYRRASDLVNAIATTGIGAVLFVLHFFILRTRWD